MTKFLIAVAACATFGTGALPMPDSSTPASALAQPYEHFGFDVLRELHAQRPVGNVFISPTSIAVALAMTSNGANGTTRDAILKTLQSEPRLLVSIATYNERDNLPALLRKQALWLRYTG